VSALRTERLIDIGFDGVIITHDGIKKVDGMFNVKLCFDLYPAATGG
jgi:hypothetical protein